VADAVQPVEEHAHAVGEAVARHFVEDEVTAGDAREGGGRLRARDRVCRP
jgi:hypothetical protein